MSGDSPRRLDFLVAGALVGQRLDKALCGLLPGLSRAAVQRAITAGACRIDGMPVSTASLKLRAGQEVVLALPDTANELRAEEEAVDILWQDEHLLLCNKPAGLTVHPCPSCPENTLVQRLLHHFPRLREQEGLRPGVVHRLDKDTSGLLLVALDEPTRLRMSEAFARREVRKEYLALVQGVPPQTGTCREPLGRHPTAKIKMAVVPENRGGKAAHSDWRVLWSSPRKDFSLVAVRIHTGRTHQIRVHMAHVGHPLLGDALYAPAPVAARAPRQMLHAWHISFCHPLSGEELEFFCPPPDDMVRTILDNSSRMQRLVITGNPGCGKSTLTRALEEAGLPAVSADALVAQLYAAGGEMADYLGRRFGDRLLEEDGSVCKSALLDAMQQDPGLRREVEQMVHTLVRDAILSFWDRAEARGRACAVAEIPLYFECGWHKAGGLPGALSLTVRCPREIRLQRIMATRGWSEEKAATLEAWQWPAERKEAASDLVLDNAGTPADLRARVPALLEQLAALRQKAREDILRQVTACWQAR